MTNTGFHKPTTPRKLKNGMIAIIDGEVSATSKKWLDIEITNYFPLVALGGSTCLHQPGAPVERLGGIDHLSIPADLRVHLTGPRGRVFFNAVESWELAKGTREGFVHLFSVAGLPTSLSAFLSGGKHRAWDGGVLLSPIPDAAFEPDRTRAAIDFVIHNDPSQVTAIANMPAAFPGWRPSYDRHGCTFGPCFYRGLQRRHSADARLLFTLRMGWVEFDDSDETHVYVPAPIFERRHAVAET
ncbi:hypothetical protein HY631_04590 [Candidatus Uhrbacteria bacterium]|nr:hypothetical protein [Candidatus Uhrbacteria bacterium]